MMHGQVGQQDGLLSVMQEGRYHYVGTPWRDHSGDVGLCAQFTSLTFSGCWGFIGGGKLFIAQFLGAGNDDAFASPMVLCWPLLTNSVFQKERCMMNYRIVTTTDCDELTRLRMAMRKELDIGFCSQRRMHHEKRGGCSPLFA